jgi:hypothetical protein
VCANTDRALFDSYFISISAAEVAGHGPAHVPEITGTIDGFSHTISPDRLAIYREVFVLSNHRNVRLCRALAGMIGLGLALTAMPHVFLKEARAADVLPNPGQQVALPYSLRDNLGMNWEVQTDGCIGAGGNGVFDAGGRLFVGENGQYNPNAQTAQFDPAHNELIFPSQPLSALNVSRRICVDAKGGWCRWIEILENSNATPVRTQVHVNFDLGAPVQSSQPLLDEKTHKAASLAVFDGSRGIAMLGAGRGSPVPLTIVPQQGNDQVDMTWDVEVPAHKTIGIMHLQAIRPNVGQARSFLEKLSDQETLHDLPPGLRKVIVNFPTHSPGFGDLELLRGDLFDIVELRGGDQYKGAIQETSFSLQTSYGPVTLAAQHVLAMLAVGEFRPSQLFITRDGEAFCGTLKAAAIHIKLASGQVTPVPIESIKRLGFHKNPGESEEFKYNRAMLMLRNGDRIAVQTPGEPIPVATRYGNLLLKPESIGAIVFQGEDLVVHQVLLTDGSHMAALVSEDALELQPLSTGATKPISFPTGSLTRLQLAGKIDEPGEGASVLALSTGDRLVGAIAGKLLLETAFDTIEINGAEVRGLHHAGSGPTEMRIVLWDETTLSGRLQGDVLEMVLKSGPVVHVPAALLEEYAQGDPAPPASVVEKLRGLMSDLGSNDWKRADRASAQLGSMGPRIVGALKKLRQEQSKPVQERIDAILKHFEPPAAEAVKLPAEAPVPAPAVRQ